MADLPTSSSCARLVAACLGLFALTGCDKAEPTSYQIPKEERSVQMPMPGTTTPPASAAAQAGPPKGNMQILPGMAEAAQAAGGLSYSVPAGWTELPASGLRKATLQVTDENGSGELTVLVFPGDVGGTLANINRWRGQIQLAPVTEAELATISSPYPISKHGGLYVQLNGGAQSILGGLLPFHDSTWFFKFIGDSATVLANETQFKAFLDSVVLEDHAH